VAASDTHFYFMVIQTPTGRGFHVSSNYGTFTPGPGATRFDLLNTIRAQIAEGAPITAGGNVTAFDIQPNRL
jgi:hypothetical protein